MKFTILPLSLVLGIASVTNAEVLSLTTENFDTETAGKNIFVKFFAPWQVIVMRAALGVLCAWQ